MKYFEIILYEDIGAVGRFFLLTRLPHLTKNINTNPYQSLSNISINDTVLSIPHRFLFLILIIWLKTNNISESDMLEFINVISTITGREAEISSG